MRWILLPLLAMVVSFHAFAADEEDAGRAYVGYIELKPFVTNFNDGDQLGFLKAEVTIQVDSTDAHHYINSNVAQIRNDLIFLFAAQTRESLNGVAAQQALAGRALEVVRRAMREETGRPRASDLFFTSFIVQ